MRVGIMGRVPASLAVAALSVTVVACVRVKEPAMRPAPAPPGASLWNTPSNLASHDLLHGPWGADRAPAPGDTYTFVQTKRSGVNPGMTVVDTRGREWSVKQRAPGGLDREASVEVALSRILSAVGYHQPAVYYLPTFTLRDDWGTHTEIGGRFRYKDEALEETGEWAWHENPFIGSQPYKGLLVLLMMFNNTDLKDSNNSIYEHKNDGRLERWYVVRDIGSGLGDTVRIAPRQSDPDAFERHPFIIGVSNGYVDFAYDGWYRKFVDGRIRPADVAWASNLVGQLSPAQWRSAFRAGGFEPDLADRFIRRLRQKIEEGRAVAGGMPRRVNASGAN